MFEGRNATLQMFARVPGECSKHVCIPPQIRMSKSMLRLCLTDGLAVCSMRRLSWHLQKNAQDKGEHTQGVLEVVYW